MTEETFTNVDPRGYKPMSAVLASKPVHAALLPDIDPYTRNRVMNAVRDLRSDNAALKSARHRAKKLAGKRDFYWTDEPNDLDLWMNYDNSYPYYDDNTSDYHLYVSNYYAIEELLAPYLADPDQAFKASNGAYAIRVYQHTTGELTPVFIAIAEMLDQLDQYPALDEDDYSRREFEAEQEYLADLADECTNDAFEDPCDLVYTASMLESAIVDNDIPFGYSYYGERWIRENDLARAAFIASLTTYSTLPCSD